MVKCKCFTGEKSHVLPLNESEISAGVTDVRCMWLMFVFNRFRKAVQVRGKASVRSDEPLDFDQQFLAAEIALEIEQVA